MDALSFIFNIIPQLGQAAVITIQLAAGGLVIGFLLGVPSALLRTYSRGLLRLLSIAYIEFFRGTPLLVQIFIVYYGLPDIGLNIDRIPAAWLALGLNSGAYQAEYFRGAIAAVSEGQMTAARAMGMSRLQALRHVVLPQAARLVLPSWSNECVYLTQYTSAAFAIAIPELMATSKSLVSWTFRPVEVFIAVAVIYLVLLTVLSAILKQLETRFEIPGLGKSEI